MRGLQAVDLKEFVHRPRLPNVNRGVDLLRHHGQGDHLAGLQGQGGHLGVIGGNPVAPAGGVERRRHALSVEPRMGTRG